MQVNTEEGIDSSTNVTTSYNSAAEREQVRAHLEQSYTYDTTWVYIEKVRLDSLKTEIELINCSDTLINIMKDVWTAYIDLIQLDTLNEETDLTRLQEIAQLCSSENGEAVHLARAVLVQYRDYQYYDADENCGGFVENRSKGAENTQQLTISPNPSTGRVSLTWSVKATGDLMIIMHQEF